MARLDAATRAFLEQQRVAHLATADPSAVPHVVPICFACVDDAVYMALDEKPKRGSDPRTLRRVRNMLDNPPVAVVADVYNEDWSQLGFVLLHARARLVEDGTEHARALTALRQKYPQYRHMALEVHPVIAMDIERVTRWGSVARG
jgi:PPOX class probable F420-dependent enzyme